MKKHHETFRLVPVDGGFRTIPLRPSRTSLLQRLWTDMPIDTLIPGDDDLFEIIQRIKDVGFGYGLGIDQIGQPDTLTFLAADLATEERLGAFRLDRDLARRGIPLAGVLWLRDGRFIREDTAIGACWRLPDPASEHRFASNIDLRLPRDPALSSAQNRKAAVAYVASFFPKLAETYFNLKDFLGKRGYETPWEFGRALYKYTACGPWTSFRVASQPGDLRPYVYYEDEKASMDEAAQDWWETCIGITIGSIVEGSDVELSPVDLLFPFTDGDVDRAVEGIDDEADFYWKRDNCTYISICNKRGEALYHAQWIEFDDDPTGTWEEEDAKTLKLAKKAFDALWNPKANPNVSGNSRTISHKDLIPIPGTRYFVREEPTPDYCY